MKAPLFFIIMVSALMFTSACKKSYTCSCTNISSGTIGFNTIKAKSSSDAATQCNAESNAQQDCGTVTTTFTCTCVNNNTSAITSSNVTETNRPAAVTACNALSNSTETCAY